MANVGETFKSCPYCGASYEHRTTLPDICLACGSVINKEPKSDLFAVPDYIAFQIEDKKAEIQRNAKPITSEEGIEAVSKEDFAIKMSEHVDVELGLFLRTCSLETVMSAILDAHMFMQQVPLSTTLKREDLKKIAKIASDIGELGKMIQLQADKGVVAYDYRAKTVSSAELGMGTRSPINTEEKGN